MNGRKVLNALATKRRREQQKQRGIKRIRYRPSNQRKHKKHVSGASFASIPDEVIIRIGKSVANLCSVRDYVRFSLCSKRFWQALNASEETVSEVVRLQTARIGRIDTRLPSLSSFPIVATTLEQSKLYETIAKRTNLLNENRIMRGDFDSRKINQWFDSILPVLRKVLRRHPSALVVLDAHSSLNPRLRNSNPRMASMIPVNFADERAKAMSESFGNKVAEALVYEILPEDDTGGEEALLSRIHIRVWGKQVFEKASQYQNPYGDLPRRSQIWVEVSVRLPGPDPLEASNTLELPPQPDYYRGVPFREYSMADVETPKVAAAE